MHNQQFSQVRVKLVVNISKKEIRVYFDVRFWVFIVCVRNNLFLKIEQDVVYDIGADLVAYVKPFDKNLRDIWMVVPAVDRGCSFLRMRPWLALGSEVEILDIIKITTL